MEKRFLIIGILFIVIGILCVTGLAIWLGFPSPTFDRVPISIVIFCLTFGFIALGLIFIAAVINE